MRGIVCDGRSATFRDDLEWPKAGPDEVKLRVLLAGVCATDLQLARGYMGFRGVLGHEFVGLDESGRRFTAEINHACHACPTCLGAGGPGHCPQRTVLGILGRDGAMADFVVVARRNLHAVPEGLDDEQAVFVEPLAAALHVADQVALGGARVAVLGDGKLGTLCAWAVALSGGEVTLVGKHAENLALAGPSVATVLKSEADGWSRRFDVVVDATGSATGLPDALRLVRPRGTVVLKTTIAGDHVLNVAPIVVDEVTIVGSRCGTFPPAIAALASGEVDVRRLIGKEFPLDRGEEAFRAAAAPGARKVLLRP